MSFWPKFRSRELSESALLSVPTRPISPLQYINSTTSQFETGHLGNNRSLQGQSRASYVEVRYPGCLMGDELWTPCQATLDMAICLTFLHFIIPLRPSVLFELKVRVTHSILETSVRFYLSKPMSKSLPPVYRSVCRSLFGGLLLVVLAMPADSASAPSASRSVYRHFIWFVCTTIIISANSSPVLCLPKHHNSRCGGFSAERRIPSW